RLEQDRVRNRHLADVVQLRRLANLRHLLGVHSQFDGYRLDELGDTAEVIAQARVTRLQRSQQDVAHLARGRPPSIRLLHVHAPVGELEGLPGSAVSSGSMTAPWEAPISKPSPRSDSARSASLMQVSMSVVAA